MYNLVHIKLGERRKMDTKIILVLTALVAALTLSMAVAPAFAARGTSSYTVIVKDGSNNPVSDLWVYVEVSNRKVSAYEWLKTDVSGTVVLNAGYGHYQYISVGRTATPYIQPAAGTYPTTWMLFNQRAKSITTVQYM